MLTVYLRCSSINGGSHRVTAEAVERFSVDDGLAMSSQQSASTQTVSATEEKRNRRLHERIAINCQVHLCWQDGQANRLLPARAIDISRFGMLVEAERAIAPGTFISVQTTSSTLGKACVRHCTPQGLKYRIGLHMPDRSAHGL
jgi:hypothetical protein